VPLLHQISDILQTPFLNHVQLIDFIFHIIPILRHCWQLPILETFGVGVVEDEREALQVRE
jgi:hypothetical protein